MSEKMREEFEAWAIAYATKRKYEYMANLLAKCPEDDNVYRVAWIDCAWIGWQASRAELVIELPDRFAETYQEYFDDVEGGSFNESKYLADVKLAIESAGLKVKPCSS